MRVKRIIDDTKIDDLFKQSGLSYRELAAIAKMDHAHVFRLLKGKQIAEDKVYQRIWNALVESVIK